MLRAIDLSYRIGLTSSRVHRNKDDPMLRTILTAAALSAAASGAALAGDIQDDIKACGDMAVEKGLISEDGTRLRYVSDKGNKNRTLTLEAIVVGGENVTLECQMKRRDVKDVVRG